MPSDKMLSGNPVTDEDPLQTQIMGGTISIVQDEAFDSSPGRDIIAVTKSDTVDDPAGPFRGIAFAGAGIVRVMTDAGVDRTIASGVLAAGSIHALKVTRVFNSTTTATDIYGVV